MGEGTRDGFVEPEGSTIGNYNVGTNLLLGRARSNRVRKTKKSRKRVHRSRHRRSKKSRRVKSRRKSSLGRRGGIHYTKKGQPYKIMPNGRARFLKKR